MRGLVMISVLALAGCGEHRGWNPNYLFGATPYGQYRVAREAALVTDSVAAPVIPVALPMIAPTGAQIAGASPVPVPPTMGLRRVAPARPAVTPARQPGAPLQIAPSRIAP